MYTYTCIGTVQSNQKGLPDAVKSKKSLAPGTVKAFRSGNILVLQWQDKRKVLFLSTKHTVGMTDINIKLVSIWKVHVRYWGRIVTKPTVVADYNKYMLGVDKLDQLVSYYSFLHKSVKWWKKVFFWMMEATVVNSNVVYKQHCEQNHLTQKDHLGYRQALVHELTHDQRASMASRPATIRRRLFNNIERLQPVPHYIMRKDKRTDCVVCSRKQGDGKRHLTHFHCETCSDNPPICPSPCFKIYHTHRNLQWKCTCNTSFIVSHVYT